MKKLLMTLTLAMAAMIAIPAANAQDSKPEQKTECCKDKKECAKDGKACAKEGKACCKDSKIKDGKKAKSHKIMKGQHKIKGPRDNASMKRRGGENPMFKGITLSEEQKTKMKALREKNLTAEKKTKADMKAKSKEEMQKLRADFDKEVEKLLDKDQLKQYQANKAEMEARRTQKQAKLPKLEKKDK
ncbi:MAG: hypothetical protein K2L45_02950 [Muribaculaceae bacterium]|nr:hypothetical protein [Muribaculaceae bacterium]